MPSHEEFTVEKLKIREDLTMLMAEVRLTNKSVDNMLRAHHIMLTGNGHPEEGISFRIKQIEEGEKGKKQNSTALWTFISSLGVLVIADFIHRIFFSGHPKG